METVVLEDKNVSKIFHLMTKRGGHYYKRSSGIDRIQSDLTIFFTRGYLENMFKYIMYGLKNIQIKPHRKNMLVLFKLRTLTISMKNFLFRKCHL